MRSFISLDVTNDDLMRSISSLQEMNVSQGADVKIIMGKNIHFTLKFLGDINPDNLDAIKERLQRIKHERFSAEFKGLGVFPSNQRVSIIWIGIDKDSEQSIRNLSNQINESLSGFDFREKKSFIPHLTIVRVKSEKNRDLLLRVIDEHSDHIFGKDSFSEFNLKKSILTPKGPIYTDLCSFKLE